MSNKKNKDLFKEDFNQKPQYSREDEHFVYLNEVFFLKSIPK